MNNELHNQNKKIAVDEDIAKMWDDLKMGRFTLDFDGMDTMTVLERAEYVRHTLYSDRSKLPENAKKLVNDINLECDREEYLPNVHLICEKMIASSQKRYEKAETAFASAQGSSNVRPGKKAMNIRRAIDAKREADVKKQLADERKRIDAQKKEMEKYVKMAPDSSYAAMIINVIKQNEESYQLAAKYLSAKADVEKYEKYEKLGVLVEEEKKLSVMAKEKEQAARLRLDNHKQSSYALQERDALLKFDNKKLMMQAHAGLLNCAKNSLAFIAIPQEMTERLLEQGLMRSEDKYYDALLKKQNMKGFHPFKKMALDREIKKTAKEYNEGLALLPDTPENKLKHPPLTTLEKWKKQNSIPEEKIADGADELIDEIPIEISIEMPIEAIEEKPNAPQITQLDLSDKIHAVKTIDDPVSEKGIEKTTPEIEKEF